MKPTRLTFLAGISLPAVVAGYLIASVVVSRGMQVPVSPVNLLITLAAIATVLLLLSVPIWRYRSSLKQTEKRPKRVDPFYAVRVLLLAKASSIAGAIFAGWHIGVVLYQLSGQVLVQLLVLSNTLGVISSFALIIAALVTEQICRLPDEPSVDPDAPVGS